MNHQPTSGSLTSGPPEYPVGRTIWDIIERLQENIRRSEASN